MTKASKGYYKIAVACAVTTPSPVPLVCQGWNQQAIDREVPKQSAEFERHRKVGRSWVESINENQGANH